MNVEELIEQRIKSLTERMRWRPNYAQWVQRRIWQERYQDSGIATLDQYQPHWKQGVILDIGSGMGGWVVRMRQEGARAIGIDYHAEYCGIAWLRGLRYGLAASVINGQGEALPLKSASINTILSYEVIEHVFDQSKFLEELYRVISPTGRVFITVPNRWVPNDGHHHLWGISYLPRPVAQWLIERFTKRGQVDDVAAGVQKLTEMYYFSLWRFFSLCRRVGFVLYDISRSTLLHGRGSRRFGRAMWVFHTLKRSGLLRPMYAAWSQTVTPQWHCMLTKSSST